MKILVIGQGPSKSYRGTKALEGKGSGDKLAKLCGLTPEEFFRFSVTLNLFEDFQGKNGKGDHFPMELAKQRAKAIVYRWWAHSKVILLGRGVAEAFGKKDAEILTWHHAGIPFCEFAVVPHPSGINRWWNDPVHRITASLFLRDAYLAHRK